MPSNPKSVDDMLDTTVDGRYRIISHLGTGGMGVVYRAWDDRQGIPVVVKIPKKVLLEDPKFAERFNREVRLLHGLKHPHVVPIFDVGQYDGVPFVVLRFLPGGSLSNRRLRDESGTVRANPPGMLHLWLPGIANALDYIHSQGVVHRDVKPANIFFDAFWTAYLGDFGIAKVVEESDVFDKEHTLTATHMGIGTQEYMAPEQFMPKAVVDGRSDQYALAVVVYEMLAAKRPFTGATTNLIVEVLTHRAPPLTSQRRDLPVSLASAVHRSLAKSPAERFPTCREFVADALRDVPPMEDEPGVARLLCPNCSNLLRLPLEAAGQKGKCPKCRTEMKVAQDLGSLWLLEEARRQRRFSEKALQSKEESVSFDLPEGSDHEVLEVFRPLSNSTLIDKPQYRRPQLVFLQIVISGLAVAIIVFAAAWYSLRSGFDEPSTQMVDGEAIYSLAVEKCFILGNWRDGLPLMAASGPPECRYVAKIEISLRRQRSFSRQDVVDLAKLWWEIAAKAYLVGSPTAENSIRKHVLEVLGLGGVTADDPALQRWLGQDGEFARFYEFHAQPDSASEITDKALLQQMNSGTAARPPRLGVNDKGKEETVDYALKWFLSHQAADGSWGFDLKGSPGCNGQCPGGGTYPDRGGATAMAVLAFLGRGYTHKEGPYKEAIRSGIQYLAGLAESGDGAIYREGSHPLFVQGFATLALTECYSQTSDGELAVPAQMALNCIVKMQDANTGGWSFGPRHESDTVATTLQLMAIRSGLADDLQVDPQAIEKAVGFLDGMFATYSAAPRSPGLEDGQGRQAVAALLGYMCVGLNRNHSVFQDGVDSLLEAGPSGDMFHNYYTTQVMHHLGDRGDVERWTSWIKRTKKKLLEEKCADGHETGSWRQSDEGDEIIDGGRLYSTALATMTLEVYYRHLPIYRSDVFELPLWFEPNLQEPQSPKQPTGELGELVERENAPETSPASVQQADQSAKRRKPGSVDSLLGRRARASEIAAASGGGGDTEQAVDRSLKWILQHQMPDGGWSFDMKECPSCGGKCSGSGVSRAKDRTGATALALLPFLGRGYTHREGPHKVQIKRGITFLAQRAVAGKGRAYDGNGNLYSQGLAGIALSECYAMSQDNRLAAPAQLALNFIMQSQDPVGGGWRYDPRQPGDTSASGWQIMALKAGHTAALQVNLLTVKKAVDFLNSVESENGARYGYTDASTPTAGRTAVGLLCRMYLGWKKDNPALQNGVNFLAKRGPTDDLYYDYYATQIMHHMKGEVWISWNKRMKEVLLKAQSTKDHEAGSWHEGFEKGHAAEAAGRLYSTSLATMILEVYYRHLPLDH